MGLVNYNSLEEADSLKLVLSDFFKKTPIRQRFKFICDHNLVGCEKWIQFEMYKFLIEYEYTDNVLYEECFDFDMRKNRDRCKQFIDITFRVKNKQYYIPLELKRKNCIAISDVEGDMIKNTSIRPSQKICFRKVFSLLFHPVVDEERIVKAVNGSSFGNIKYEYSLKIGGTRQFCSVFSSSVSL